MMRLGGVRREPAGVQPCRAGPLLPAPSWLSSAWRAAVSAVLCTCSATARVLRRDRLAARLNTRINAWLTKPHPLQPAYAFRICRQDRPGTCGWMWAQRVSTCCCMFLLDRSGEALLSRKLPGFGWQKAPAGHSVNQLAWPVPVNPSRLAALAHSFPSVPIHVETQARRSWQRPRATCASATAQWWPPPSRCVAAPPSAANCTSGWVGGLVRVEGRMEVQAGGSLSASSSNGFRSQCPPSSGSRLGAALSSQGVSSARPNPPPPAVFTHP